MGKKMSSFVHYCTFFVYTYACIVSEIFISLFLDKTSNLFSSEANFLTQQGVVYRKPI